ncbi:MAG: PH domain-containing protein [Legionella sp.]
MNNDSNIIYQARLHWIIFVGPITLLGIALYLAIANPYVIQIAMLIVLFASVWLFMAWLTYEFSLLMIKRNQVILCTGVLVRTTIDIPLSKIESIDIRQTIVGSLLHYGSLVITGTGGTQQKVSYLSKPLTCRRYIEQNLN